MTWEDLDLDVQYEGEPLEALVAAWNDETLVLGQRARALSRYFTQSRLTLEGAARFLDAPPAELEALMDLAMLGDEDLVRLSKANPPKTTWLFFAEADQEEVAAGIRALDSSDSDEVAAQRVYDAMRQVGGPTLDDRIAGISGATLGHMAKKAKDYDVLSKSGRGILVSCAKRKQVGRAPSEKQLEALKGILTELVEREVIRADSPDGDQEQCDEVLIALGLL